MRDHVTNSIWEQYTSVDFVLNIHQVFIIMTNEYGKNVSATEFSHSARYMSMIRSQNTIDIYICIAVL